MNATKPLQYPPLHAESPFELRGNWGQTVPKSDVREALAKQGMEVLTSTPDELGQRMKREAERWAQIVKAAHIKAE